jgi:FkbM family methyltransferase
MFESDHTSVSTSYFVFSKTDTSKVDDSNDSQIVFLNRRNVFLLPEVNIDYYAKYGLFECQLIEWCKQFCKSDKVFLDVGAHTGTYSISLAKHCSEVYSFEPQRMTYYALCGGVALSNIRNIVCCNVGLGSDRQIGHQTLNIVSRDGGGSTIHQPADNVLRTETIEIRTLDSYQLNNIGFIKMDVEENELFVLQGGLQTLERSGYPPIVFESNIDTNTALFHYLEEVLKYTVIKIGGCINMYLAVRE